ncbi:hypothetical protein NMY22_g9524 [Coprinellus aureogranulatus]|nr:hypothetical protein NMY22_g9524 [Coprinellus aureogranulatus]
MPEEGCIYTIRSNRIITERWNTDSDNREWAFPRPQKSAKLCKTNSGSERATDTPAASTWYTRQEHSSPQAYRAADVPNWFQADTSTGYGRRGSPWSKIPARASSDQHFPQLPELGGYPELARRVFRHRVVVEGAQVIIFFCAQRQGTRNRERACLTMRDLDGFGFEKASPVVVISLTIRTSNITGRGIHTVETPSLL